MPEDMKQFSDSAKSIYINKTLITVDEHNAMIAEKKDIHTGVLCPQCQNAELLWDLDINPRLNDPPQRRVECSDGKCTYTGYLRC